jgi:hypothetical protein
LASSKLIAKTRLLKRKLTIIRDLKIILLFM